MSANSKIKASDDKIQRFIDLEDDHDRRTIDRSALKRLMQKIWLEKKLLVWGSALLLITTLTAIYEPRLLGHIIDEALKTSDRRALAIFVISFFVLQIIRILSLVAHTYIFSLLGQNVMQTLRMDLFRKMQSLPASTFSQVPAGKLVTRVTNDVSSLADMFTAGFVTILGNVLFTIGIVVWLVVLNPMLGLISLSVMPIMLILSVYFSKKLKIAYTTARARLSALNAFFAENILGMKVIFLFNRQAQHLDKFRQLNNSYASAQFGTVRVFSMLQPTITLATGVSMALIVWFGGNLAVQGGITLGFLATYFAYVLSLFQPVREIADKWNIFLAGMASVERIFSILDWESEDELSDLDSEALPFSDLRGHIQFKNVWFAYDGENWVLKDFSFEIFPGQKIGIVGPTGSGKTTLINLLLRFYEPQRGEILLDGKPLKTYEKRKLRSSVGLIQQDVFLFSGSVVENMTLWRRFDPEIRKSLQEMTSFNRLEREDLENLSGLQERGGNMSMGERQLLAFARALHTKPRLWILDEATSNMDSESERELEELLKKTASHSTTLMIAHRLASVKKANQILVLQNGHLIEVGSHFELMKHDGLYSRLYKCQEIL